MARTVFPGCRLQGHLAMFANIFGRYNSRRWVLLTRGTTKHVQHRTAPPTTENDPAPNGNSAEVEKP